MDKRRAISGGVVVALCGVLGAGCGLLGCSPQQTADAENAPAKQDAAEAKTMNQWGEEYPLQFNSYAQIKVNKQDSDKEGHFCMRTKELGPVARDKGYKPLRTDGENYNISWLTYNDQTGEWVADESVFGVVDEATKYTKGCFSCRSSKFQEIEAREGEQIYKEPLDQEFIDEINGQIWDCALCHGDTPGSAPDSRLTYWNEAAGDAFDDFEPTERVCGQCHTTMSHTSVDHYRYGTGIDGLYDSKVEQEQISVEEETGIMTVTGVYEPDVEFVQDSPMRKLGVTCASCHMPKATDPESGQTYTMHNASGSPLDSKESLEYCLTCHESRGISSTDEMANMVRGMQEEAKVEIEAVDAKLKQVHEEIAAAVKAGTTDEKSLDTAREKYSRAKARHEVALGDANVAGMKVAHNPEKTFLYLEEADQMLDEALAALA